MIHDHVYLEGGAYKGLSDRWLGNVGLYPDNNVHINGAAPYWRAAYQFTRGEKGEHRSEEHTSELQSQSNLVCRLLLEKKKKEINTHETRRRNDYYGILV